MHCLGLRSNNIINHSIAGRDSKVEFRSLTANDFKEQIEIFRTSNITLPAHAHINKNNLLDDLINDFEKYSKEQYDRVTKNFIASYMGPKNPEKKTILRL